MAMDLQRLFANLRGLLPLDGCHLLSVGSGGGQMAPMYANTARVDAVDVDPEALARLRIACEGLGFGDRLHTHACDFLAWREPADVVLFEFCLHEMPDPGAALAHARSLAPVVGVYDHAPESDWAFSVVEDDKVARSTAALEAANPCVLKFFEGLQAFPDHATLVAKVGCQGPLALARAESYRNTTDIVIPMRYLGAVWRRTSAAESRT